ncbi:MAG: RNA polymerase, sigma 70 subunit, RpoD family [Candidatus Magasanikbacteria bacterium]|nr:RNA polymerase, sigma 70 subunit, RpoD family [Candidatus Magasanikbacteria bacterium]
MSSSFRGRVAAAQTLALQEARQSRGQASGFDLFFKPLLGHIILTPEETAALFRQMCAPSTDPKSRRAAEEAGDALLLHNLKIIVKMAARFRRFNVSKDDLVQVGMIALFWLLPRFDPSRGSLATFIMTHVRRRMFRAACAMSSRFPFKMPDYVHVATDVLERVHERLRRELGRSPMEIEILAAFRKETNPFASRPLSKGTIRLAIGFAFGHTFPLAERDGDASSDGKTTAESLHWSPSEMAEAGHDLKRAIRMIDAALDCVGEKDAKYMRALWGVPELNPLLQTEVGRFFRVSRQAIQQSELRVLNQMPVLICARWASVPKLNTFGELLHFVMSFDEGPATLQRLRKIQRYGKDYRLKKGDKR